jgi:hypothetical protein
MFGLDQMIDDTDKIADEPAFRVTQALEQVLRNSFLYTQARVASPTFIHTPTYMPTGSLKLSGRTSSDLDGSEWSGEIRYGGPSAGPNNPVEYAIYEMARGGIHDFFEGLEAFDEQWIEAMGEHFS